MNRAKKVFFPKIRLQEMLNRPGGIGRDQALEGAMGNLREISGESDALIIEAITVIEAIGPQGGKFTPEQLRAILEQADQIVTLAGTFGYSALDSAARGLCDITDGLLRAGLGDAAPIVVHVRAVRLFAPSGVSPSPDQSAQVLGELRKIMAFYELGPIA